MMRRRSTVPALLKIICLLSVLLIAGCSQRNTSGDRQVRVPKDPPKNTIAVFPFRWTGDADAKFYAQGFSRALSDRLYGTADCQINQPDVDIIGEQLRWIKQPTIAPISDDKALVAARPLGARYALTGDFTLKGDNAEISVGFFDLGAKSPKPTIIKRSGKLSDLPEMQTVLAAEVVRAMGLNPDKVLAGSNAEPSFTKPSVLLLYGRSFYAEKIEDGLRLRWRCVKDEPDSVFAALRVLGMYVYSRVGCRKIQSDKRLQAFIADAPKRFPDDCQMSQLVGELYLRQYQYKKAEEHMREAVKRFPDFTRGHSLRAIIAMERWEPDLAMSEAEKAVSLWPTGPIGHANLARVYMTAARSSRWAGAPSAKAIWAMWRSRKSQESAYREATIALALDPRDVQAWQVVMNVSRELGYPGYDYKAFQQLVKLDPKNYDAYGAYSRSLGYQERDEFCERVDRVFGKDSAEACLIRGWLLRSWADSDIERAEVVRLAEKALAKSKNILPALSLKTEAYISLHKRAEMLQLAKKGYALDPSPYWASLVARGYEFRWEDKRDPKALNEAYKLWTHYVDEFPNAAYGHDHLGWCLSHMGQRAAAKKEFERALQIDPGDKMAREKMPYVQ